jgi:predicted MFS family arabinose efflux permease
MSGWKIYFSVLAVLCIINIINQYMSVKKVKDKIDLNAKGGQFEFDVLTAGTFFLMYIFIVVLVAFSIPAIFMK